MGIIKEEVHEIDEENRQRKLSMSPEKKIFELKNPDFNPNIANRLNDFKNNAMPMPVPINSQINPNAIDKISSATLDEHMESQMKKVDKEMDNNNNNNSHGKFY